MILPIYAIPISWGEGWSSPRLLQYERRILFGLGIRCGWILQRRWGVMGVSDERQIQASV
jgi:hypothetical protein